jgi:hypothetical protein
MGLPLLAPPVARGYVEEAVIAAGVTPSDCDWSTKASCVAQFGSLVLGSCDPAFLPEGLGFCLMGVSMFFPMCSGCLEELPGDVKGKICSLISMATAHGVPVPSALQGLC